ncbi:hypothetical protein CSA37_00585 [Candidatus Fermentibacteria bacterium]|nr:MAG: hypothetical protein CSA37_09815 [Candidatus Fermentibacteria bacterium]PIE53695.1 MAG: hypothetical protein CSA37_00585 [Candidatus Fermentibacteria bacterium]
MTSYRIEELSKPKPSVRMFFDIIYGVSRCQALEAGILTGIFDFLSDWISAEGVAEKLGSHQKNTGDFLDALASMKLVEKNKGLYRNTAISSAFLRKDFPGYLGEFILSQAKMINMSSPEKIRHMVMHGPPEQPADTVDSEKFWGDMAKHYVNYMQSGIARYQLELIREIPELSNPRKILDLGGGPGLTAIALAGEYPDSSVTVFEQPPVAEVVNMMAEKYGVSSRVRGTGGNYITDAIGEGYDLIFASFTLNYARKCLVDMMVKIRNALTPGGIFVSVADGLTCERTCPSEYVVPMLSMVLADHVEGFDMGEVAAAMSEAGLEVLRSLEVESPYGPVVVDIGKRVDS